MTEQMTEYGLGSKSDFISMLGDIQQDWAGNICL